MYRYKFLKCSPTYFLAFPVLAFQVLAFGLLPLLLFLLRLLWFRPVLMCALVALVALTGFFVRLFRVLRCSRFLPVVGVPVAGRLRVALLLVLVPLRVVLVCGCLFRLLLALLVCCLLVGLFLVLVPVLGLLWLLRLRRVFLVLSSWVLFPVRPVGACPRLLALLAGLLVLLLWVLLFPSSCRCFS